MKMFSPSTRRVAEILRRPEFGRPTTFYLRDPEKLPLPEHRRSSRHRTFFLDHIAHPAAVIHTLLGPVRRLHLEEGPYKDRSSP